MLRNMNSSFLKFLPLAAGLAWTGSGCVTTQEDPGPPPASQADVGYLREEIRRLHARFDATDAEIGRLQSELMAASSGQPEAASAAEVRSVQTQLDDLQRQIRVVDAARAQDKKEIYDDISKKIATLLKSAAPAAKPAARAASQTGYEHVVQPGETLSKIAAAYKVNMSVVMEANGLKNADSIRVGQKLFIPD